MTEPRLLKGFRDFLPNQENLRSLIIERFSRVCRLHCFAKIDTPVLEYKDVLLSKAGGETEKQIYEFTDNGGREVAMRFDLTVPFARFYAMNKDSLEMPFKRFQIGKVFRGENTQRGRYREFIQFDFDIMGSTSVLTEKEVFLLIQDCFNEIHQEVEIHFFSREVFNSYLSQFNLLNQDEVLRMVDKSKKITKEVFLEETSKIVSSDIANKIYSFISERDESAILSNIKSQNISTQRLEELLSFAKSHEINLILDPSITRGLDYYTGVVFETFLSEDPSLGAICSGGRYDNLLSEYSKDSVSGFGGSFGIDRILSSSLMDLPNKYFSGVLNFDNKLCDEYINLLKKIRNIGIPCDFFLDDKKLKNQFNYFEKKGVKYIIIMGQEELARSICKIKDTDSREEKEVSLDKLEGYLLDLYEAFKLMYDV